MADRSGPDAATDAFNDLAEALGRYLDAIGWTAVVVGSPRIQDPDPGDMNYEFVVRFTGGRVSRGTSDSVS